MKVTFMKKDVTNQWLFDMVKEMNEKLLCNIKIDNDKVVFPENIASGFCSHRQLTDEISVAIFNLTFKVPIWIERQAADENKFYAMHINCSPSQISYFADGKESKLAGPANPSIFWSASDISSSFKIAKGETFSGIIVYMTKAFLQKTMWNNSRPSHICTLRGEKNSKCLLSPDSDYQCNFNIIDNCLLNEKHIISKSLHTGLGRPKYELVQEIINFERDSSIPEILFLKANILKILVLFIKRIANKNSRKEQSAVVNDALRIFEIKKIIDTNAGKEHISLTDLAKSAAISKTKLKTKFKEIVGKTAYQYYLDVKMEKAKSILEDSAIPISDLAYELGFKSTSHFSQAFKKHYGVNPKSIASKN